MILEQKRGGYKKTFKLEGNTLSVVENNILNSNEWSIHLEHIGHNKIVKTYSRLAINFIGYSFFAIAVIFCIAPFLDNGSGSHESISFLIFGLSFLIILGVVCLKAPMDNHLTIIEGKKSIKFFLDSPSRNEVEKFANELIRKSKKIILDKYSRVDPDVPEETFMGNLHWLLQNNYIDNDFYEEKKMDYKIAKLMK